MSFSCCAIVPSHNHHLAIGGIVAALRRASLPVFVIDDGSDEPAASRIAALHAPDAGVRVTRLPVNGGKGAAMAQGFRLATDAGFTHALQIDADGQHDVDAVPDLLAQAQCHPQALVAARPLYDRSVPLGRQLGRWLTHVWVWVETLSLRIGDSMCGLRIYPLAPVAALLANERIGRRMDFDTDIMVRLFWRGVPVLQPPVRVTYPAGNLSNFDTVRDNLRISWMHTRLLAGMLLRLPSILANRPPSLEPARHWAALQERGLYLGIRLMVLAWRLLGRHGCLTLAAPVVLYFWATGRRQRRASFDFLARVRRVRGERPPSALDSYRHFLSFAGRVLDSMIAWTGALRLQDIRDADPDLRRELDADPRGRILVISHHGNVDAVRASLDPALRRKLIVLVHTRHAANYNRVLRELNPAAAVDVIQVSEIGPETAMHLKEQVDAGRWLVIAGDRPPLAGDRHVAMVPFLGAPAAFAHGPFVLAAIMGCPISLLFCRREGSGFVMSFERFAERIELPRGRRRAALDSYAALYAARLETAALAAPLQWHNFFDFWASP